MTFFTQEMIEMLKEGGLKERNAVSLGRAVYVSMTHHRTAKLTCIATSISGQNNAILVEIINTYQGRIDSLTIKFEDRMAKRRYIGTYQNKTEWYGGKPDKNEMQTIGREILQYIQIMEE